MTCILKPTKPKDDQVDTKDYMRTRITVSFIPERVVQGLVGACKMRDLSPFSQVPTYPHKAWVSQSGLSAGRGATMTASQRKQLCQSRQRASPPFPNTPL
jgi:hypothetical protein